MEPYVIPLANYFEDNSLIQEQPHSIQLSSSSMGSPEPGFILKMVVTSPGTKIPENEMVNISALESELKSVIFKGEPFKIKVCNENFVPL